MPDAVVTVAYHNHSTRFDRGEPVDVFLTDSAAIDELIKRGKVAPGRTDLARTAVRRGASKPDVSSPEALKRALLEIHRPYPARRRRRHCRPRGWACSTGSASPPR
jgi:hypothetical protein